MNRYKQAQSLMEKRNFIKIVCGAGNEDSDEVRRLTLVYTLAGAAAIDVSANPDIVRNAVKGIDAAFRIAPELDIIIEARPFINVSVGLKGDPHARKAQILEDMCIQCGKCAEVCEQNAISDDFIIITQRCIGCGICAEECSSDAIEFFHKRVELTTVLPDCIKEGAEMLELHAVTDDDVSVLNDWKILDVLIPENYISVCLDRSLLSDKQLVERIEKLYDITGERLIVQADGAPMSGGSDDYNTTLQAVAIADIVQKSKIPVKILASGGTNSKSQELATLCGVRVHGVSLGTHARKIVRSLINSEDFENNTELIKQAVLTARKLVLESRPEQM
ncbi:MAG: 4Fe-4S binding protein [Methanomicrobiaceae archaeon]|nr:4Fe-4S binding protein [Methanomicrobiaceae archaeon]